jgi:predicted AAA+ superfamily ATPase
MRLSHPGVYHGPAFATFETAFLDQLLRSSSWQPAPPSRRFFRTHAGRETDFVVHAGNRLLPIEVKAGSRAHCTDTRRLTEVLGTLAIRGLARTA